MRLRTSCWVRMCGPVEGLNISMLWKWSGKVRPLVPRPAVLLSFFFCSASPRPTSGLALVVMDA